MKKESYLKPDIKVVSVLIEKGFAGTLNNPSGEFGHEGGKTEWEEED